MATHQPLHQAQLGYQRSDASEQESAQHEHRAQQSWNRRLLSHVTPDV
ncbi:hypothetical protein ACFS5L_19100 [Streptomyces phyllanthi]|nr:hypothetical protein [Streptomyces phyllanthi]